MDITLKGIENCTEKEVAAWVAVLVKRKEEKKLTPPQEAIDSARNIIDTFRVANGLEAEFAKEETESVGPVKE
jgi:hypothetical protein